VIALTRQNFVTSSVCNLGATSLSCHLAGYRMKELVLKLLFTQRRYGQKWQLVLRDDVTGHEVILMLWLPWAIVAAGSSGTVYWVTVCNMHCVCHSKMLVGPCAPLQNA
jgi:hypothetical protein